MILGVDWIASMGDITMNLGEGMMALKKDGKKIKLVNKGDAAEIQMCEGEIDICKERKKGSQMWYGQLFKLEEENVSKESVFQPLIKVVLAEFQSVF